MVYIVLPAYNEGLGVSKQIHSLNLFLKERNLARSIVVVNDGSSDHTFHELEKLKQTVDNLFVIHHKNNSGPGKAFKSGFEYILPKLKEDDVVITMDCDNTQHLKSIDLMLSKIKDGYEVVLGSIFTKEGVFIGVPFFRKCMTYGSRFLYQICFPIKGVKDYTAFYRAVKGSALKLAFETYGDQFIESSGFGCMAEMLIKFRQLPVFITEVPMIVRYDLKTSKSKLKVARTIAEHLRTIRKNFFRRHWV